MKMIYGARQCASLKMAAISFYYSFVSFNSFSFYGPPQICVFPAEFKLKFAVTFIKSAKKLNENSTPRSNKARRFPYTKQISYLHFYWISFKYFFLTQTFTCHVFFYSHHLLHSYLTSFFFLPFFRLYDFTMPFLRFSCIFCYSLQAILRIVFAYVRPIHYSIVCFRAGWPLAAAALGSLRSSHIR